MSRGILRKPSIKKSLAAKYKGAYTRKFLGMGQRPQDGFILSENYTIKFITAPL